MGKDLRFVFRNFPLTESHPHALAAAQAAEAAGLQGRFWEMHDLLYENQEALEDQNLVEYARELNLDVDKFRRDFSSDQVTSKIEQDVQVGIRSGVNGTPTFFVDGNRYDGSYEYAALLGALERHVGPKSRAKAEHALKGR